MYNWQRGDWPNFVYQLGEVEDMLFEFTELVGHVSGVLKTMPEAAKMDTLIDIMVVEAIKTSEIEGEYLSRQDVVSSIRNNLGLNSPPDPVKDRVSGGAGELMVAVRDSYAEPLTQNKLFEWHRMLLGESRRINAGAWRKDEAPMQVISGVLGKEKIHFEAPPSAGVPDEMDRFISWFNNTAPGADAEIKKAPVRAAIAHLYFESIHPFEDGNGRIGRVIAEKALLQTISRPVLLSLSRTIEANKKAYYTMLEEAQKSNEISRWVQYFVQTTLQAQRDAQEQIDFSLRKAAFFDGYREVINDREVKVLRKMMDAGAEGFEGGMSAKKYMSITGSSKATATRDLQHLVNLGH